MELSEFCRALPKVELHAHLNGSLSMETIKKLSWKKDPNEWDSYNITGIEKSATLAECFKIFDIVHSLTDSPTTVSMATREVIQDFHRDNVVYLELRTTPRAVDKKMTKFQYLNAVITGISAAKVSNPGITVKLLISLNRKDIYATVRENVDLILDFHKRHPQIIVGVDLSGDPTRGDPYLELLQQCRDAGLKIAVHCGEVPNEGEVVDILRFGPDRLGHCTCVHPYTRGSESLYELLLHSQIPVELCPTSNVKCRTVPSYEQHHFIYLYRAGHPICIGTDDKGVFDTTLSREYELLGKNFGLSPADLKDISLKSVQYSFATDEEKAALTRTIQAF